MAKQAISYFHGENEKHSSNVVVALCVILVNALSDEKSFANSVLQFQHFLRALK